MKIRIMTLLASAALALPAAALAAEVPQRGMSEARVRADFGSPSSVRGPVGSPAITRWNYDGFSVYFENGITLHTVVDRPASTAPDVVSGTQELPPIEETATDTEQEQQTAPESTAPPMFDPVTGSFVGADTEQEAPTEEQPAASEVPEPEAPQQDSEPEPEPEPEPAQKPQASATKDAPEAVTEPAAEPQSTEQPPADGEFRFDPVTGRIIIAGEMTPEQAAAKKQQQLEQQAKETAETTKAEADQTEEQVIQAVNDAEQQTEEAVTDTQKEASDAEQQVEADVQEKADEAEQKVEQVEEESEGGFSIDWDARR